MISINIDTSALAKTFSEMGKSETWLPAIIDAKMGGLGGMVVEIMRDQVGSHRYTGELEGSIKSNYNMAAKELRIGPQAQRGGFDAGTILEKGTQPINVPWKPIKTWANLRGMTDKQAYFVMKKIRQVGLSPHPFIAETIIREDFSAALEAAAFAMGLDISARAISGGDTLAGTNITGVGG